jgi:hypothetical protein
LEIGNWADFCFNYVSFICNSVLVCVKKYETNETFDKHFEKANFPLLFSSMFVVFSISKDLDQLKRQLDEKEVYIESLKKEETIMQTKLFEAVSHTQPLLYELNTIRAECMQLTNSREEFVVKSAVLFLLCISSVSMPFLIRNLFL